MKKYLSTTLSVAFLTMLSQVIGYIREMLFAFYLGTSKGLEAFQVAETIPLLFTQILISAVPLALTPLLVREQQKKDDNLIHSAIVLCSMILLILVAAISFFPNIFVGLVAPGFHGDKFVITCRLVIILAPNVFFLSMVSIFNSFLNANNQFIIPTAATLLLNGSIILMQILTKANIYYVAVGSVCGGILMFLTVLIICCFKYNLRVTILKVNKTSMKMIIGAILPVCIISSFTSINLMLDKFFASLLGDGAVAILSYSYKIVNLPVYLFITSVTKVMLPDVTRLILNEHKEELSKIIKRIVLFCISGAVVTVILFQLLGNWVVQLLFGRGAFGGKDIAATAISLKFYACGIAGMALSSFFQSISYA